ncbi:MAG: hypothetical protein COA88_07355 [Kordia sp.]|nr:MAG: hypothetical protein COA88_07355 [Kordia sp.]
MNIKYRLLLILLIINVNALVSQNNFDIIFPQNNREQLCQRCTQTFTKKSKEVKFSIVKDKSNNLFFEVNDKKWFTQLFKNSGDGIAIDIVSKKRYDCTIVELEDKQLKGHLLKPVYASALKRGLRPSGTNKFKVRVGVLPKSFANDNELEYNILFLNDKNLCRYQTLFNLDSYAWDLLDMGMYLESLTYKTKLGASKGGEGYTLKHKTLKFIIPFEKNKSEYSQEDIKPLYDSLQLTDFTIKKINIKAYASVEGNLKRNIELQEQRANSIAKALQSFQKSTIINEVSSSENWVEFLNDVSDTKYASFKKLSKSEIKRKLVGEVSKELEIYLKKHRKAVVSLELEKKDKFKDKSANELLSLFKVSIANDNVDEVTEIQNSLFEKLKNQEISPDFLDKMNLPQQVKYARNLNNNSVYKYFMEERNLLISMNELERLEKLTPKDGKVKYNLSVLKFTLWRANYQPVDAIAFKKQILGLKQFGISQTLIQRMLINYHIVKSEKYMRKRDYTNKDKAVAYILKNYKKITLSDFDYLSLSQYLTYYSNYKNAIELLEKKVRSISVDEDLLFYYLNMTLIDNELTKKADYRTIMLNAINMNKERYCKLFNSKDDGGVTFQLLDNEYLRKTYCENCNAEE